jgi:hypothetical protein
MSDILDRSIEQYEVIEGYEEAQILLEIKNALVLID